MDARLHLEPALDNAPPQAMLRRRVMEEARPLARLRDPADQHPALGGMQIAARRIHAQRPARAARPLPRRERERVFGRARKRAQVNYGN